jgi:hypothetical protein
MEGILGKLGQTWPVKLAESIYGAFALPGQVAGGVLNVPPSQPGMWSDEDEAKSQATQGTMMNRAADLAGLVMGGGYPMAQSGALGMAGGRGRFPESASIQKPLPPTADDMARASRVELVPLSQARGTQTKMYWDDFDAGKHPAPLLDKYADRPVAVRREDGEFLLMDGHHRAYRAFSDGTKEMEMYVIDAKDYAPWAAGKKGSEHKWTAADDELLQALLGK